MNLRDLEYVVAVAETLHFGRAAQKCFVSQPTLSAQVSKLESEIHERIFERDKRSVRVTQRGQAIVEQAEKVLSEVRVLRDIASKSSAVLSGPFYLGVIPTVGPYMLPHVLPLLKGEFPGLDLYIREGFTQLLLERLRKGELDAAILSLPIDDAGLTVEDFYEEAFVAVLPPGDPLESKSKITMDSLEGRRLLFLEEGNCMREQTLEACRNSNAHPVDFRATSIESLRQMVTAGLGCTLLPKLSVTGSFSDTSSLIVRSFESPEPSRKLALVWRRSYPHEASLKMLVRILAKALA